MHYPKSADRSTFSHNLGQKVGFLLESYGGEIQKNSFWGPKGPFSGDPAPPQNLILLQVCLPCVVHVTAYSHVNNVYVHPGYRLCFGYLELVRTTVYKLSGEKLSCLRYVF